MGGGVAEAGQCDNEPFPEDVYHYQDIGGLAEVLVGVDTALVSGDPLLKICATATADGTPVLDERVLVHIDDDDPSRTGRQVRLRYCSLYTGGSCLTILESTGIETETEDCGNPECLGDTDAWVNDVGNSGERTGVDDSDFDPVPTITDGAVVCPFLACYQEEKIDFGTLRIWADGEEVELNLCFVLPPVVPNTLSCPPLVS